MTDVPSHSAPSLASADGHNDAIWLTTLRNCALASGGLAVVLCIVAWVSTSMAAMLSVLLTSLAVMAFFSLSLLAAHVFGKHFAHGAVGTFIPVYLVKVVALGVLLWLVRTPEWYHGAWALWSALALVVLWQGVEIWTFAKARFLAYAPAKNGGEA